MSVDHDAVLNTVRAELRRLDGEIGEMLRFENETDDPPDDVTDTYVEESMVVYAERPIGSGIDRLTGEVRYTVVVPRGSGTEIVRPLAVRIKGLFRHGASLVGETVVVVERCEILSGRKKDATRYAMPVAIMFRSDAPRDQGV